jgi:hypothetical protein
MATTKNVYAIDKFKKLIDLNGETTNFDISFRVRSQNGEPFDILVVDQTTLDNTPNLEYKRAPGEISGNLVHDKNVYQNYFIILKADNPCNCEVEIIKKELPKTPQPLPVQQAPENKRQEDDYEDIFYWLKIALSIGIVTGILVLIYWTVKKDEGAVSPPVAPAELPAGLPAGLPSGLPAGLPQTFPRQPYPNNLPSPPPSIAGNSVASVASGDNGGFMNNFRRMHKQVAPPNPILDRLNKVM